MPKTPHPTRSFQTSPSKKYIPYNTKPPKRIAHLIQSGGQPSAKCKKDVKAAKADYEATQGTIRVEIADAAGGVSAHRLVSTIPSVFTPRGLQDDKGLQEDTSSQKWLEDMADIVPLGDDSSMAPLLSDAPGSKSRIRATVNREKRSAWRHWRQKVIYQAVGIYLKVETKRANKEALPIPVETVFTQDHRLQSTNERSCNSCRSLYEFHSIEMITFSG